MSLPAAGNTRNYGPLQRRVFPTIYLPGDNQFPRKEKSVSGRGGRGQAETRRLGSCPFVRRRGWRGWAGVFHAINFIIIELRAAIHYASTTERQLARLELDDRKLLYHIGNWSENVLER